MARDTLFEKSSNGSSGLSLAVRLRDGSAAAWREMVELYGPLLDRWCRVGNIPAHAISDIAQETFMAAFRGLDRFDPTQPNATFRGWLWTVARSRIIDYHRQQQGKQPAAGGSTAHAQLQSTIDPLPVDDPTEPDHASALLHRALTKIRNDFEEGTWDLFWRATVMGHPTDLIARENDVTPAAVRQAKSRVLRSLRKQLGDQ